MPEPDPRAALAFDDGVFRDSTVRGDGVRVQGAAPHQKPESIPAGPQSVRLAMVHYQQKCHTYSIQWQAATAICGELGRQDYRAVPEANILEQRLELACGTIYIREAKLTL